MNQVHINTDDSDTDKAQCRVDQQTSRQNGNPNTAMPVLFHKVKDKRSILALVVSKSRIFAGTQGGEIIVSNDCLCRSFDLKHRSRSGHLIRMRR